MKLKEYLLKRKQRIINKNLLLEANRLTDQILRNPKNVHPMSPKLSKETINRDFILNELSRKLPAYKFVVARTVTFNWCIWVSRIE